MTQKIQATQKKMHNQTRQKWATLSNTVMRYSLSQALMSNAICKWRLGGGGGEGAS